jgi:hypothetical protein
MFVVEFDAKHGAREHRQNAAFDFDVLFHAVVIVLRRSETHHPPRLHAGVRLKLKGAEPGFPNARLCEKR